MSRERDSLLLLSLTTQDNISLLTLISLALVVVCYLYDSLENKKSILPIRYWSSVKLKLVICVLYCFCFQHY